ncbi:hypothetical protein [Paracoccus mutanolyticus]|nr:hypothetical protein [Paracoccus mutanolyticus]
MIRWSFRDIWPISNPQDYKLHFARWNQLNHPLAFDAQAGRDHRLCRA